MHTASYDFLRYPPPPSVQGSAGFARDYELTASFTPYDRLRDIVREVGATDTSDSAQAWVGYLPGGSHGVPPEPAAVSALADPAPTQREAALNALRRTLVGYLRLPQDWDGYGGRPARPRALVDAFRFLAALPVGLPLPAPMLAGSGVIGLYWGAGNNYASIEFEGDGTYTYLTDSPAGYGGGEGVVAHVLAAPLERYLTDTFVPA